MDALQRLKALAAVQSAERELVCEEGLPMRVREGAALCAYTWAAGELASLVEPDGTRFDYRYGDDGRLLGVDRNGKPWARYGYDSAGRLEAIDRPDGPLAHQYDADGRLVCTRRGDASPFVYRWEGNRVSEARSDAEHSRFEHDAKGRLVGLVQRVHGQSLSVRFDFDAEGRLQQIEFPEWRQHLGFRWDERGRPAAVSWNGRTVSRFGTDDAIRLSWAEGLDGVRSETWHESATGRPMRQRFSRAGQPLWEVVLERDLAFRLVREGARGYAYDGVDRLIEAREGERVWRYRHDLCDDVAAEGDRHHLHCDAEGRVQQVQTPTGERVFRHNQAGELLALLENGECVARCLYDHKGRLVRKDGPAGTERYLYGADDALLAVADGEGRPRWIVLRLPTGLVGLIDFRRNPEGEPLCLHCDSQGNLVFAGSADGELDGPPAIDPFGAPLQGLPLQAQGGCRRSTAAASGMPIWASTASAAAGTTRVCAASSRPTATPAPPTTPAC